MMIATGKVCGARQMDVSQRQRFPKLRQRRRGELKLGEQKKQGSMSRNSVRHSNVETTTLAIIRIVIKLTSRTKELEGIDPVYLEVLHQVSKSGPSCFSWSPVLFASTDRVGTVPSANLFGRSGHCRITLFFPPGRGALLSYLVTGFAWSYCFFSFVSLSCAASLVVFPTHP